MRIPITKYGCPQVIIFPLVILLLMAGLLITRPPLLIIIPIEIALTLILLLTLAFFRDPNRNTLQNENLLFSPADGTIVDISTVEQSDYIAEPAILISIFLSIFNVHINRAPCNVKVENIKYKKGWYKNARNPLAGKVNESNILSLVRIDHPKNRLIVRQISGAIARRIVCSATPGQRLKSGEKFGMIKFGSKTEIYVPLCGNLQPLVKIGDKVKAGLTPIAKYQ